MLLFVVDNCLDVVAGQCVCKSKGEIERCRKDHEKEAKKHKKIEAVKERVFDICSNQHSSSRRALLRVTYRPW